MDRPTCLTGTEPSASVLMVPGRAHRMVRRATGRTRVRVDGEVLVVRPSRARRWVRVSSVRGDGSYRPGWWGISGRPSSVMPLWAAAAAVDGDLDGWAVTGPGDASTFVHDATRAVEWARSGWSASAARQWWLAMPEASPGEAQRWVALGGSARDAATMRVWTRFAFTVIASVPREEQWGALLGRCSPGFAKHGYTQGQDPAAVERLARAMGPRGRRHSPHAIHDRMRPSLFGRIGHGRDEWRDEALIALDEASPWDTHRQIDAERYARALVGLDWDDVAACLEAGMDRDEATGHVSAGRPMEPVRLLAALA